MLNLCTTKITEEYLEKLRTMFQPMSDEGLDDINKVMEKALPFMEEAKSKNKRILVHCRLGVNRSATIGKRDLRKWLIAFE